MCCILRLVLISLLIDIITLTFKIMKKIILVLALLFTVSAVFTGCREKKETPGEKIEKAIEDTGDALEDAADDVEDVVDDVVDEIEN